MRRYNFMHFLIGLRIIFQGRLELTSIGNAESTSVWKFHCMRRNKKRVLIFIFIFPFLFD